MKIKPTLIFTRAALDFTRVDLIKTRADLVKFIPVRVYIYPRSRQNYLCSRQKGEAFVFI